MKHLLWSILVYRPTIALIFFCIGDFIGQLKGRKQSALEAIKPHHLQPLWWRSRIVWAETRQYEKAKNPNED